ncbi:MAG: OmpA family protein [Candidatus Coatesbacteria bacterium]|nr:OmpA family protein [Candidatus Coatesbacteria bacterium]
MSDSSNGAPNEASPEAEASSEERELQELREVIAGPQRRELEALKRRLDDPRHRAQEISRDLPEAIALSAKKDNKLTKALMPTVEEALEISVKKQPRTLANVIFPLMGPAIRKAIGNTLREMIQSLNKTLEHGLSLRGIRWRIEALRTGKSFAEVVLLHTLAYRVEQVFLIHKHSGILLQHLSAESVVALDSDVVSGMLTAIQDFVRDSFAAEEGDALETMQVGDLTVWIEEGPEAVLAVVIRGEAPQELRSTLRDALESVHLELATELASSDGDMAAFDRSRPHLEDCLVEARAEPKRKRLALVPSIAVAILVMFGLGSWLFLRVRDDLRWADYLDRLSKEKGIVITSTEKRSGVYHVMGLRDPLARDPMSLLAETSVDPNQIDAVWAPFQALEPQFILTRANQLLAPPETASLRFEGGKLYAVGSAPHRWIIKARDVAGAIAGVDQYDDTYLEDQDVREMHAAVKRVEGHTVRFALGTTQYAEGQLERIEAVTEDLLELLRLAHLCDKGVHVRIVGHTDSSGTEAINAKLSQQRAHLVLTELTTIGSHWGNLSAHGVGASRPVREELTEEDRVFNRSVTFEVQLTDLQDVGPHR